MWCGNRPLRVSTIKIRCDKIYYKGSVTIKNFTSGQLAKYRHDSSGSNSSQSMNKCTFISILNFLSHIQVAYGVSVCVYTFGWEKLIKYSVNKDSPSFS